MSIKNVPPAAPGGLPRTSEFVSPPSPDLSVPGAANAPLGSSTREQWQIDGVPGQGVSANTRPAELSAEQRAFVAEKKATCPFIGSAVKGGSLPVRNSEENPLASIGEVIALGDSGGGDLGSKVLKIFAEGNHAFMAGASGQLDVPVVPGFFSLDFPGSRGSHAGHSGILQGDPKTVDSGRFDSEAFDRLLSRAEGGYLRRSDIAKFIAENLDRDPDALMTGRKGLVPSVAKDVISTLTHAGSAFLEGVKNKVTGSNDTEAHREAYEALTKTLGRDNLVGSAGEFGLLMAFLANSPKSTDIKGEPALSVEDVTLMFKEKRFPDGWETWPKNAHDWVVNTTALTLGIEKARVHNK